MSKLTLVTGLWDIGRGDLQEGWSRSFQHYLDKFEQLLDVQENMIIFGDESLKEFVFKKDKIELQDEIISQKKLDQLVQLEQSENIKMTFDLIEQFRKKI